jgi:lipid II:glycine glycyltransferase (peptidoglycan interpeptide bridge formation enzyme)
LTARGYPRQATSAERAGWDERTVRSPGGHVYQSTVWADQRARLGWRPLYVMLDPDHAALVLLRPFPLIAGASAYVPRGPVVDPDDDPEDAAARVAMLSAWLAGRGVAVVATDAEVPAARQAYGGRLRSAGFRAIPEIQPSRHRVSIELAHDTDDDAVRAGLTKSARQRVSAAERDDIIVERHDAGGWSGAHPIFQAPTRSLAEALGEFATLLEQTGERVGFTFGPRHVFVDWWAAAHAAGMLVYLDTRDGADPSRTLGGLLLYRHGERLSTVHSGDAAGVRETHPGVMHLLRWRAIQLAIREGRTEMDLGGVDIGPDHLEPGEGAPMAGLYEHKRSFGARWIEMTGAQERVTKPLPYAVGRLTSRVARILGR